MQLNFGETYRVKATIFAKKLSTGATQQIVLTDILSPLTRQDYYPIILSLSDIGSSTHNEIPSDLRGSLTIDNNYNIGFKKRFTDLLDEYVFVNQQVKIDIENSSGSVSENVLRVDSVDIPVNGDTARIAITKRGLSNHPVHYSIKKAANVIPGSVGRRVPLVFGASEHVNATRLGEQEWAVATNFVNDNESFFSRPGKNTTKLYFPGPDGYLGELDNQAPSDHGGRFWYTPAPHSNVEAAGLITPDVDRGFRPSYDVGFEPFNFSGYLLTQVRFAFTGSSANTTPIEDEELFTVEVWENSLDIFEQPGGYRLGMPGRIVSQGSRKRKDFQSQIQSNTVFWVQFVLDEPVPLVPWPKARPDNPYYFLEACNYTIFVRQGGDWEEQARFIIGVSAGGHKKGPGQLDYVGTNYLDRLDNGAWLYMNFNTSLLWECYGANWEFNNRSFVDLKNLGFESSQAKSSGLSCLTLKINAPLRLEDSSSGGPDQTEMNFDKLKPVVELDGMCQANDSASIATTVVHAARLLTARFDGAWDDSFFDSSKYSGTHGALNNLSGISASGLSRAILETMLFWHNAKCLYPRGGDETLCVFAFGQRQAAVRVIDAENCILDRVQELPFSTVVNNPSFDFSRSILRSTTLGGDVTAQQLTSAEYRDSTVDLDLGGTQQKSIDFFGSNYLRSTACEWIGSAGAAISSAALMLNRFAFPAYYILLRVPLFEYNELEIGQVVLVSHGALPYIAGGDGAKVPGLLYDETELAHTAADGRYQKLGKSYRCLIEGREIVYRKGEPPMLKLALLSLHNVQGTIV